MRLPVVKIELPEWIEIFVDWNKSYNSDEEKMSLAIALARENIVRQTGGPFGAAIFDTADGKIISIGINRAVPLKNSTLHAETVAIAVAQTVLQTHNLNAEALSKYELFTSCEPCCMCLGATLWSGVSRLVCAATKDDASRIGFDEGPVYESSYEYLTKRGITVTRQINRAAAVKVFDLYVKTGGIIYNR